MSAFMDIIVAQDKAGTKKWTKSMKRTFTIKPVPKSDDKVRRATDKYWCGFFTVVFITWIASWQYAVSHNQTDVFPHEIDYVIIPDDIADGKNISEFSLHEFDNTTNLSNGTATEKKNIEFSELLYLYLYIFTCDLSHMDKYIKILGKLVILFHVMGAICFLHTSLFNMRQNKIFSKQPSIIGATFIFIALIEHLSKMFHSSNPAASPFLIFHENLAYWVIPEMMFLIIWLSKMISAVDYKDSEVDFCAKKTSRNVINNDFFNDTSDKKFVGDIDNNDGPDSDSDNVFENDDFIDNTDCGDLMNNSDDDDDSNDVVDNNVTKSYRNDCEEDSEDAVIPFHYYIYAIIFGFPFVIILKLLTMYTISVLHKLRWTSPYSYVIAGGSFYVGLTIYYFTLMLTACATNILIDRKNFTLDDLQRALYIVGRYHFGTACYHATLIFPRLHATLVMNESEFKIGANYPILKQRFYTTHGQIYDLSRTIIAARGHNHADSIRELLRLFASICVKKEYFRNFNSTMTKSLLAFLLSINCLTICLLWIFRIEDPHFAKAAWLMYLSITFAYYVVIRFFKTVSETIGLRLSGREVNFHLGRWNEIYSRNVSLL